MIYYYARIGAQPVNRTRIRHLSYNLPPIMTTEEVADFFRTCTETIHPMERSGEIESIPGLRRRVKRYRREVALALLDDEDEDK
jgi:hypothetical protein